LKCLTQGRGGDGLWLRHRGPVGGEAEADRGGGDGHVHPPAQGRVGDSARHGGLDHRPHLRVGARGGRQRDAAAAAAGGAGGGAGGRAARRHQLLLGPLQHRRGRHGAGEAARCLSKYFEPIVEKLLAATERQDGSQSNLRSSAYEALMEMIKNR